MAFDLNNLSKWTINLSAPGSGEKSSVMRDGEPVNNVTSVVVLQKVGELPLVVVTQQARAVEINAAAKKSRGKRKPA